MNKPSYPAKPFEPASPPYELDAYGWSMAQAQLIRDRRLEAIDWENVAEEIESVGKSEQRAAESNLRVVLVHHLKWAFQPFHRSRSWANSIAEHLRRFDRSMDENPSLKPKLASILDEAYTQARHEAARETGLAIDTFPPSPPSWAELRAQRELDV